MSSCPINNVDASFTSSHYNYSSSPYTDDSSLALSSYARTMHQHTKKQMDAAARLARRRSSNDEGTLGNEGSTLTEGIATGHRVDLSLARHRLYIHRAGVWEHGSG
ncbi:hypothetical protein B0J14DRAFT_704997 [Halenospora varia]|nr:hypothetical protein B0J14DRAFT_704997 [Halenospora varia]